MIFVSIAAYKDSELESTIQSLYDNADSPDGLSVHVLNQCDLSSLKPITFDYPNLHIYYYNYKDSRGVCWARNFLQELARSEEYFMQIDSHMRLAKGWDTKMIDYLEKCNARNPILSYYPAPYDKNGIVNSNLIINTIRGIGYSGSISSSGTGGLGKAACDLWNGKDLPMIGETSAAGFLFGPSDLLNDFTYDTDLYWNYEETDQTLHLWLNGWQFFGLPECLIWHKYKTDITTPPHFTENANANSWQNKGDQIGAAKLKGEYLQGTDETYKRKLSTFCNLYNVDFTEKKRLPKENKDLLVVVPYRDREQHLAEWLERVPSFLKEKGFTYDVFICELEQGGVWNAGMVCNSLVNFYQKHNYKYLYISHVDIFPTGQFILPSKGTYYHNLGDMGSCLMHLEDFFKAKGYPNTCWRWGGEDDILYSRLNSTGLQKLCALQAGWTFDDKYQNHNRKFDGVDYGLTYRSTLEAFNYGKTGSVHDVNKSSYTSDVELIGENIYKAQVKLFTVAPSDYENENLLLVYTDSLSDCMPLMKSALLYSAYNYDITFICYEEKVEVDKVLLESHGAKVLYADSIEAAFRERSYKKTLFLTQTDVIVTSTLFEKLVEGINPIKKLNIRTLTSGVSYKNIRQQADCDIIINYSVTDQYQQIVSNYEKLFY